MYSDYDYKVNFVGINPERDVIRVFRVTGKTNLGLLTRIINDYSQNLVASFLSSDYGALKSGVYVSDVSSDGEGISLNDVKSLIVDAVEKFRAYRVSKGLPEVDLKIDEIHIEQVGIPSRSYAVANLLNNLFRKRIPLRLRCPRRPGEHLALCLDINILEEFWNRGIADRDERFLQFCKQFPGLCRNSDNDGCSRFFKVVKSITMRVQHIVTESGIEQLYLVLHHYYRRLSSLGLDRVLEFLSRSNLSPQLLVGVRVNYRRKLGDTLLCEVRSVTDKEIELRCESEVIRITQQEYGSVTVNPTYKQSRDFIEKHICKHFDAHRTLNRLYPRNYFSILENEIIKIVAEVIKQHINRLCIGGACFSVESSPLIVR